MTTRTLAIKEITAENVAPYGTLVTRSAAEPAFSSDEFDFWNELAVDETFGALSVGMVEARAQELTASTFERHAGTSELLAPLDGDVIIVLGEPTSGGPDVEKFEAFRLRAGSAILLGIGTWHFAPMTRDGTVAVLVVFRKGTPDNDMEIHRIDEELGAEFHIIE